MTLNRLRRLHDDERGMSLVFVGLGMMGFLAATTLAIDVGMLMTARTQAQTSADSGALAGATALAFNDFNDRSPSGPAVQSTVNSALANVVIGAPVSVGPGDVTFPNDPSGVADRVHVQVYRTAARGNPLSTLMAQLIGIDTADISAAATAEASPANAETCVKPFTIPDRWTENQTGPWDPTDTFDMYDNKGNLLPNADVYVPADQPGYTGYNAQTDKGLEITLKANNGDKVSPSFYNPWDLPGSTGGEDYRNNIDTCNTAIVPIGSPMTAEPGNMVGPTAEGTQDLVARDPNAYWDTTCNCVQGSAYGGNSPRIAIIPVYDPAYYATGKANGRNAALKVANYIGFFIEQMNGNEVVGRITPVAGIFAGNGGPAPAGAFPRVIRLVE
ncbi:MAG: TadE/TadG family type IV pilus assembly protein [Betaproteobacteria bacterium]